jgi:hypothetical protein
VDESGRFPVRKMIIMVAVIVIGLLPGVSSAHHGSAAFDTSKPVTVKGTVTEWFWANPHCFLKFDVKDDKGNVAHWAAEVSNPPDMVALGWSKQTFHAGDEVTVTLLAARNGTPTGRIQKVTLADGRVLVGMQGTGAFPNGSAKAPDAPAK